MDLSEIIHPIHKELTGLEALLKEGSFSNVGLLSTINQYIFQNGGKRIRPAVLLLSAKLANYNGSNIIPLGAAIEMIHTASLLHDDVLDGAFIRRGQPSVNTKWGNKASVLAGDFLLSRASALTADHGNHKIIQIIADTVGQLTEGQTLELMRSGDLALDEEVYLKIVEGKTAVLFGAACRIGAVLGELPREAEEALGSYGHNIGMAFQLRDDVLDYISDSEKPSGTDLREGKLTLPAIWTLKRCSQDEGSVIKGAVGSSEGLLQVLKLMDKYGVIEDVNELTQHYSSFAKTQLKRFNDSSEKNALIKIADYVALRCA